MIILIPEKERSEYSALHPEKESAFIRQYTFVVLICISLRITGVEHLFICLPLKNIYSDPLPVFYSNYLFFIVVELHEFFYIFWY